MITDPELAKRLLQLLDGTNQSWALLHGAERLRQGTLDSDLDLVISRRPETIIPELAALAASAGLLPVLSWRYDAVSLTTFWSSSDASEVVQLDLTHDPKGYGKYGVKTGKLLEAATESADWPVCDGLDEQLYLLSKRLYKGQCDAAAMIANVLRDDPRAARRSHDLMSGATARAVMAYLERGRYRRPPRLLEVRRVPGRLLRPTGHVLVVSPRVKVDLASRLRLLAPDVRVAGLQHSMVRSRRPYITINDRPIPGALRIRATAIDEAVSLAVRQMSETTLRRLDRDTR